MQRQEQQPVEEQDALVAHLAPADWATADEIRRRGFSTAEHGFDPDEVRAYLTKLGDLFAGLNAQINQLRREEATPPGRNSDGMSGLASRMAEVLREAETHAGQVREEADAYAGRVRSEADSHAEQARTSLERDTERIRTEAGRHAATALEEARREASRLIEEATQESERIRTETGGQAYALLQDAEHRMNGVLAMRDAILKELGGSWERIAAMTWEGGTIPPDPSVARPAPGAPPQPVSQPPGAEPQPQ